MLDHLPFGNTLVVELPFAKIPAIAALPGVTHVGLDSTLRPHVDSDLRNDPQFARDRMLLGGLYNLGYRGQGLYIGVIDSGVRDTHTLFSTPDRLDFLRDCRWGDIDCTNYYGNAYYSTTDECQAGHGTPIAALIAGSANLGSRHFGHTEATVDSWRYTFHTNEPGGLDPCLGSATHAIKAIERAVYWGDSILNLSFGSNDTASSPISLAADDAFDAGAVVIASAGNDGPAPYSIDAPANARRAFAAGAFDVDTFTQNALQSRGPTSSGRIKPDAQFPTDVETASIRTASPPFPYCDTCTTEFANTSGAAPQGVGAAASLISFFNTIGLSSGPGHIYAALLAFGSRTSPDNTEGAGKVSVRQLSPAIWSTGTRTVLDATSTDITFTLSGQRDLTVAIWWPEYDGDNHDDIDLYIFDPSGTVVASGLLGGSVFELGKVSGLLASGTWTIRLYGYSVPTTSKLVYYFYHMKS